MTSTEEARQLEKVRNLGSVEYENYKVWNMERDYYTGEYMEGFISFKGIRLKDGFK